MQRENKWQDRLQDEFMDFWDSKKESLNLGEYSDAVTQFWISKIDTARAEVDKEMERIKEKVNFCNEKHGCMNECSCISDIEVMLNTK